MALNKIKLEDIFSDDPKVKYTCAKNVLAIAKANPSSLYNEIDFFIKLLDNENQILKWTAIDVIGYLSKSDKKNKIDKLLGKLFKYLNSGKLITAAHAISALSEIALNKPAYLNKITQQLLKVEHYKYETTECHNIILGKVILGFRKYFNQVKNRKKIMEFIERQTSNTRSATRKKAEEFLKKVPKIYAKALK